MKQLIQRVVLLSYLLCSLCAFAQSSSGQLPQMQFKGAFSSGHKDFNIYKMFDPSEDVLCYIMMPTLATKTDTPTGQITYDGNSIGALSCFKIFAAPAKLTDSPGKKK